MRARGKPKRGMAVGLLTIAIAVVPPAFGASTQMAIPSDGSLTASQTRAFSFACGDPSDLVCAQAWKTAYIAYLDPICQTFVSPTRNAVKDYIKNFKEWVRRLSKGTLKGWVRQTQRTAQSLRRFNQIHASLTQQIADVPPHPNDVETITTWLNLRNRALGFYSSAASSFSRFKFDQFRKQLRRGIAADEAAISGISGFGFQVCDTV